jgi:histidinol-phosphate/aromatic aminotransferase/cobyric acid decarboxylase-like protein
VRHSTQRWEVRASDLRWAPSANHPAELRRILPFTTNGGGGDRARPAMSVGGTPRAKYPSSHRRRAASATEENDRGGNVGARLGTAVGFPLQDYIDGHADVPHNLAKSGVGPTLPSVRQALTRLPDADPIALRAELARTLEVAVDRLFLTHGATEGNSLVLWYLAQTLRRRGEPPLRCRVLVPEYPPLAAIAGYAGFQVQRGDGPAEVLALSAPNNPTGLLTPSSEVERWLHDGLTVVADETFREFGPHRSLAVGGHEQLWTTGTFTKAYGGDGLRVGFVIAPPAAVAPFARFHAYVADGLATASVQGARALLRDRERILVELHDRMRTHLGVLREKLGGAPHPAGPLWFDRTADPRGGDALAERALAQGVLVCPGSFFDDASGVRLCLTQPTFAEDLDAYLVARGGARPSR